MTEKRSVMKNHLPKRLFNSGNINLIPKFHGENLKIDGLLNRLVICLNIYCFVLSFCLLLHRLAVRINLPFYIFLGKEALKRH